MAVQAPAVFGVVRQLDVVVKLLENPALWIDFHFRVALHAWEHALGDGRRRDLDFPAFDGIRAFIVNLGMGFGSAVAGGKQDKA